MRPSTSTKTNWWRHGQYGHVQIKIEPNERGAGFEFIDKIVGGVVPKNYIPAVEKGIVEAMKKGVLASYPVVDAKVTLSMDHTTTLTLQICHFK